MGEWHHLVLAIGAAFLLGWKIRGLVERRKRPVDWIDAPLTKKEKAALEKAETEKGAPW
jgi:hypothetical protein